MAWHCKSTGGYVSNYPVTGYPDSDGIDNCREIWNMLRMRGWTPTAVAGLLACIALESGYNPWRWQNNNIQSSTSYNNIVGSGVAYGLVQWDPASYNNIDRPHRNQYIENPHSINLPGYGPNLSDIPGNPLDGAAQIYFLDDYGWVGSYQQSTVYPYYGAMCPTFASFKSDTVQTPADLATVWAANFERSSGVISSKPTRDPLATQLYVMISNWIPLQPTLPTWLLMKWRDDNMRKN